MTDDDVDFGDPDMWANEFNITHIEENLSKCQWENRDGKVIKFRRMETSHIKNCIAYIQRRKLHIEYGTFSDYIDAFNSELERRNHESEAIRKILAPSR